MDSKTDSPIQESSIKKGVFEDLSRDELIVKCKGFLGIAQKAKQAKTELQNEIESYKLQLEKCKSEKITSQENLKTLQELVDSLTEQKLNYITDLDAAQNAIKSLQSKCNNYEDQIQKYKADFQMQDQRNIKIAQKLSDTDSELISLKRQNKRLLDENEHLINQLAELEASAAEFNDIGLQQREQLRILEEKVQSDEKYLAKIEELNDTIKELENKQQSTVSENKLKEISQQYESEKVKNEKANIKLKSYRDKILKCATCINQLKNSRYILTKTVKEYSENIPKWQNDIIKASKVIDDQMITLDKENRALKEKLELLEKQAMEVSSDREVMSQVTEIKSENNKMKNEISELQKQLQDTIVNSTVLTNENTSIKAKLSNLREELRQKEICSTEKDDLKTEISNLQKQIQDNATTYALITNEKDLLQDLITKLQSQLQDSLSSNTALNEDNKYLNLELSQLQKQLQENISTQAEVKKELTELKSAYEQLKESQIDTYINEIESLKSQVNDLIKNDNELIIKNKELKDKIKELKTKNENLNQGLQNKNQNTELFENLNLQIKALESEKATLVKEKLSARDNVLELENQNKLLSDHINNIRSEVQTLKAKLETLSQEKTSMELQHKNDKEEEINNLKQQLKVLQEEHDLQKKEFDNLQDLNGLLKEEVETLKLSLEQPNDDTENVSDLNVSLQADIVKLETKLSAYKQENASLLTEVKESRAKVKEFDSLAAEYEDMKSKLSSYKTENAELLHEMKEINQVLKERGESISKLQKAVNEMERLIETLEKDRDTITQEKIDLNNRVSVLENDLKNAEQKTNKSSEVTENIVKERDNAIKALAEKEAIIESLKDEIEKLKQHQTSSCSELPNEDMSTSTISRAEEHARMKDLDETFEEKYTKLRIFALKLKKKLNETTTQLQNVEQDKARLEKLVNDQDVAEIKAVAPIGSDQVDNVPKVGEGDGIKSDKITELEMKIKSLTAAVEASDKVAAELGKVKAELHSKTQELTSEIEAHKTTKENLEKARRDIKKKNVLSLEMEDYERSLKDLTTKMEENKRKMVQMESTIDTQEGTITAMKTQIKLLEEQIKSEETQTRLIKEDLQHAVEESRDKDQVILMKNDIINKLEQNLEDEKRKNEEADLEMTSVLSEKEKVIMNFSEDKIELNNKLKRVEFKCAELNELLRITNIELADLKTEHTSYKVRAQAVLRQNQTVDHSQEEQLKEEAAALRTQIETLTAKITTAQEQLSEQSAEVEASRRRAAEATGEAARAQQRTSRLQADLTRLGQQLESERTQHKLQISTLTQCYKTQINELEAKLQKETEALRKQLLAAQENVKASRVGALDEANHNQYMLPVIPKEDGSDGEMDINVSMIPREEGEGSEAAPSPPLSKSFLTSAGSGRSPVPLERLLEEGVPEDEALDSSSLGLTPDQEISDLKRKLQAQHQRVGHVTVLLSESERECARMAQLAELLKAELRRVRGAAAGAHNTEYMKNVTFKFLTLPPGDERSRLVPVIQKILTLTPDETQKIQAVAKGQDPNATKSWGSYLPWPGGK